MKGRLTNHFTKGGQEDTLADIDSLSQTMVEARAQTDALYNSEENEVEWKLGQGSLGLLQTMTALKPKFIDVTLACDDILTIQTHKVM